MPNEPSSAAPALLPGAVDSKPYVAHHPIIGYSYIPNTVQTLAAPGGGHYTLSVNADGIRSDREYTKPKPTGVFRMLVFGDSMSAGQFLSNEHRFSELLERRLTGLEVINMSLEGSGTDQQLLIFEQTGVHFEFDLVLLFPFLQNIRRNMVDAREGRDPATGDPVLLPKPRFELVDGELTLRNVPVPKERFRTTKTDDKNTIIDADHSLTRRIKTMVSGWPGAMFLKKIVYAAKPWEPFPEYKDPQSPPWRLMEAIVRRFKTLAKDKPLVVVPTFYANYVRLRMARNYWNRYRALAAAVPGVYLIDLLPHFKKLGADAIKCFQEPHDMHFSKYGNLVVADILQQELTQLGLLKGASS
jgi:carbamoyltransferase